MGIGRFVEQEENRLEQLHNEGKLSAKELQEELQWLYRDAQGAIEEEAQKAYDDVMNSY